VKKCDVAEADSAIFFSLFAGFFAFMARIMQGSATNLAESVIYELSGTLSEVFTADILLRGETPTSDIRKNTRMLSSFVRNGFSFSGSKVQPSQKEPPTPPTEDEDDDEDAVAPVEVEPQVDSYVKARKKFCGVALIHLSLSECTSILASATFWLVGNANPAAPGSNAIPADQTLRNLAIMLAGELVLTDGLIAYIGRHSTRYKLDPVRDWKDFKASKAIFLGSLACITLNISSQIVSVSANNMCLTSWLGEEEMDWVMTSCPPIPRDIHDMVRVGSFYRNGTKWEL